jgi:hypothetical protein
MSAFKDLKGKKFDSLLVLERAGHVMSGNQKVGLWKVQCDCGKVLVVRRSNLKRKHGALTKSCGCKSDRGKNLLIHGLSRRGKRTPEYIMWGSAKHRAKVNNVPFDISPEDVIIPEYCPIFGVKLETGRCKEKGKTRANAASLDRIVPELGYVKGNIEVISYRANSIKQDATYKEIEQVAEWLKRKIWQPEPMHN